MEIDLSYIESAAEIYQAVREYEPNTATSFICLLCGGYTTCSTKNSAKRYCPVCGEAAQKKAIYNQRNAQKKAKKPKLTAKKPKVSFSEILRNAEKEGLTYGQYVLKHNL